MGNIDMAEVCEWARAGGAIASRYFNNVTHEHKADQSLVTQADIEVEQMIRAHISNRYPDHGIMGEEQGIGDIGREYVWSIDPIDGTGAFASGLPLWCVSIGVLRAGEPYVGVVYMPLLDDCYWAGPDGVTYLNDKTIHIREPETFAENDWISVSSFAHRDFRFSFPGKTRSLSSVAADFCYAARGSSVGTVIGRASLWDIAAGITIVRGAGGVVTTLSGKGVDAHSLLDGRKISEPLLAAGPTMVERLRDYVTYIKQA